MTGRNLCYHKQGLEVPADTSLCSALILGSHGESGFQGGTIYVKYALQAAFLQIWFSLSGKDNSSMTQRRQTQHVEHL